jgi:polysaccharide export outer membrane protein
MKRMKWGTEPRHGRVAVAPSIAMLAVFAVLVCAPACRAPSLPVGKVDANLLEAPYRIHPGDTLNVKFEYHPRDTRDVMVDNDGHMALPVTGDINVAGLSLQEAGELIAKRSSRYLRSPVVEVRVVQSTARAFIGGEVLEPGFVPLTKPTTALQAVIERGGFLPTANLSEIVIVSHKEGTPMARRLDLREKIESGELEKTLLSADEILIVPKTGIAKANQFVQQYLNNMTPQVLRQIRFGTIDLFGSGSN